MAAGAAATRLAGSGRPTTTVTAALVAVTASSAATVSATPAARGSPRPAAAGCGASDGTAPAFSGSGAVGANGLDSVTGGCSAGVAAGT
ncbi:hypothetical protein [Kitasatospora cheerisanensis]|uniref:Uncharacterized protein n=1 Tax=Kitasatospora cheerisanensis KCTC 2395 TaxID=1348663 RepID=A0A066Z1R2_9ACTN|nr:hypothetical protein [Kitasatospora cheerisanensis]KDN84281.1 hypothetical protein KCH_40720 [Kitasatospora cheerisanensis KCTC 2395]